MLANVFAEADVNLSVDVLALIAEALSSQADAPAPVTVQVPDPMLIVAPRVYVANVTLNPFALNVAVVDWAYIKPEPMILEAKVHVQLVPYILKLLAIWQFPVVRATALKAVCIDKELIDTQAETSMLVPYASIFPVNVIAGPVDAAKLLHIGPPPLTMVRADPELESKITSSVSLGT